MPGFTARYNTQHCYCPDLVTGELLSLLGFEITHMPKYWRAHRIDGPTSMM